MNKENKSQMKCLFIKPPKEITLSESSVSDDDEYTINHPINTNARYVDKATQSNPNRKEVFSRFISILAILFS